MMDSDAEPAMQSMADQSAMTELDSLAGNAEAESHKQPVDVKKYRGIWWATLLLVGLFFVYMIVLPAIDMAVIAIFGPPKMGGIVEDMSFSEKMRLHSVSGVVLALFVMLGGTVGSFLNVVIYRVPLRKPLLWPPSSCPSCGSRIAGKDNIPVFGWILLFGKCRSCQNQISARYPIVEAIVAAIFVLLYYVQLTSGGKNIPVREPNLYTGVVWVIFYTKWDLLNLYFYHCSMLAVLLAWGMINHDGFTVPKRNVFVLLTIFASLPVVAPYLHPVPMPFGISKSLGLSGVSQSISFALLGVAAGGAIGYVFAVLGQSFRGPGDSTGARVAVVDSVHLLLGSSDTRSRDTSITSAGENPSGRAEGENNVESSRLDSVKFFGAKSRPADYIASFALIGVVAGAQAALGVMLLTIPLLLVARLLTKRRWAGVLQTGTVVVFAAALVHQVAWRPIHHAINGIISGFGIS